VLAAHRTAFEEEYALIYFSRPSITDLERRYAAEALDGLKLSGDGPFTKRVRQFFAGRFGMRHFLLVTSGTHALEMAALLFELSPGDEVIMPSFTFVSTANAVLLRGAVPVFADISPDTLNMDCRGLESLVTARTRAIFPVHYAGVPCDMDAINALAKGKGLYVAEDAAQAVGSSYKGRPAGTLSDAGCFSFHDTKNYTSGEGGGLVLKNDRMAERAEIIREKGTDRSRFLRGQVDKYTWRDKGSSYLPSDLLAAVLAAQLERFDEIMEKRMAVWNAYHEAFAPLEAAGKVRRPVIPPDCAHNAHLYYLLWPDNELRDAFIAFCAERQITAVFHYIPLHLSDMGKSLGYRAGGLPVTESCAERLVRLPLYAELTEREVAAVAEAVFDFARQRL